jgi:Na+/H+-dicarboxylate symporter
MFQKKWLLNPWTLIGATLIGILSGYFLKAYVVHIELFGNLFLASISMCILPLIIFSMVSSFAKAVKNKEEAQFLMRFLIISLSAIVFTAFLGVLTALSSNFFGVLDEQSKVFVGNILVMDEASSTSADASDVSEVKGPLVKFLELIIAPNIVNKIAEGNYLPLLLFSCLLGLSLGFVKRSTDATIKTFDDLYYAVVHIIAGLMYFLPFALVAIFANFVAEHGFFVIANVAKMLVFLFIMGIILFFIQIYLIARVYKRSFITVLNTMKQPVLVGFMTSSSLAAFPSLVEVLEKGFQVPKDLVELATPLSLFLNQQGTTLMVSFITILLAHLFQIPLNFELIIVIMFSAVLFSIASSGTPFIAVIALFAIPLAPIGIPLDSVFVFLIIIFLIADPLITAINVSSNITVTTLLNRARKII